MKGNILIIDDKEKLCQSLTTNFNQRGFWCCFATNRKEAFNLLEKNRFHVVLLDIMLGQEDGMEVLGELIKLKRNISIIMITGYGSIATAVKAIKLGAFDYITKPLEFEKLLVIIENAVKMSTLSTENHHLKKRLVEVSPQFFTQNRTLQELCEKAKKLGATDLPVLVTGENGTGKELIADLVHLSSQRHMRKMLKINCAAFPESLLDNELFGHEKGAYTGADSEYKGVFERANRSSLFLDEIGDMPLTIQAKILRTLQNSEVRRLGGDRQIKLDVRFIAATNKDLKTLISLELFREDLFYRLNVAMLYLLPLRDRKEDIPLLVEHFLQEYTLANSVGVIKVDNTVMESLLSHYWPGNVRELKNTINYAVAISSGNRIGLQDLPPSFTLDKQQETSGNIREEMDRNLIIKMLQKANYNKKKAAELLNMSRKTLYNKLDKYGISLQK
ncbi:MAG: sigma-54-dependent Fis family transcriptional regulator [Deltaproteobacteria bacterium]|jgi:DNA-binding NtrC family response regulator|nr:sigma-54-dependent Fis family transcriptional regulator [Deltaproteobacteria bacterium]